MLLQKFVLALSVIGCKPHVTSLNVSCSAATGNPQHHRNCTMRGYVAASIHSSVER